MSFKKISRRIKLKLLVRFRKKTQEVIYLAIGNAGNLLFKLLRNLRLLAPLSLYDSSKIKRILVVRPDRIGDLILATPVLYNLRRYFTDAHIALLIQAQNRDLVSGNPHINELVAIRRKGIFAVLRQGIIGRLREGQFDLAIVLYPSFLSCLLVFLGGIPHRIGYDFHGSGFLLTRKLPYRCQEIIKHEVDVNLDLLGLIDITPERKELAISIDPQAEISVSDFLESHNLSPQESMAVVHPGAYEEYIRWKISGFAQVADTLISEDKMRVIILAGPGEEKLVQEMASLMRNKAVLATGFSLAETASLIKRAKIFIGNSTGPMHIAAALKIPVVAIFGSAHPLDCYQKWGPYGTRSIILHSDIGCKDCQPVECFDYPCMKRIKPKDVLAAVKEILRAA